jgi:hypothetical protein
MIKMNELELVAELASNITLELYRKKETPEKEYFDTKEAATYLSVSYQTMTGWRQNGGGPKYHKPSPQIVRYKKSVLDDFMSTHSRNHTSEGV